MITTNKKSALIVSILVSIFIFGCSSEKKPDKIDYEQALQENALKGFREALSEDYTQLTIIRGSLYKFSINPTKPRFLGISIGALQAMVFPEKYEYDRLSKLENLSPQIKKEIISQPYLNIVKKKREILTHLHNDVLEPLAKQMDKGQPVTEDQLSAINSVVRLLDRMVVEYAALSKPDIDFNGREAEEAFYQLQNHHSELMKIKLPDS